jgi:tRNA(fMet)-specific endonuclease VapC
MIVLLDTNVVIAVQKGNPKVIARIKAAAGGDIGISCIVMHELYFGAFKSDRIERNLRETAKIRFPIIDFTRGDARMAGEIRADLQRKGTPIGPYDALIAGQALARNLTLVTRNTGEFARVPGLTVEDWEG